MQYWVQSSPGRAGPAADTVTHRDVTVTVKYPDSEVELLESYRCSQGATVTA